MKRLTTLAALIVSLLVPALVVGSSVTVRSARPAGAPELLAFRGGFHLGGGGFGRRGFGVGGFGRRGFGVGGFGRRRSHLLRRIAHALVFAYILHLFFSHGGLSILLWLVVIAVVVHFLRRGRRRRRAQYS